MRLLLGVPGRHPGLRLPGPGRAGRGRRGRHRRRAGSGRPAPPHPGGVRAGGRGPVRLLHARPDRGHPRPAGSRAAAERRPGPRGAGRQPLPLHRLREDPRRGAAGGRAHGGAAVNAPDRFVIEGCAVATVDTAGTEHANGYLVVEGGRIVDVGPGPCPSGSGPARLIDGSGCLATPGLVNCHHHLYQWLTRGLAQQATLFEWLTELYPVWARLDAELEAAAARAALAALLTSGCSTTTDHHYVFPAGAGDLLAAEVEAAAGLGIRFHPCRGSMDLGRSRGGLPPDEVVEDRDAVLAATEAAIDRFHDPAPEAMVRVAVAPCSPFSVSRELLLDAAELARRRGVRLHTHLAETVEEERFCLEQFGRTPVQYLDDLGWLGDDVWLAHCVHLDAAAVGRLGETGTGVAHCPSSNARLGAGVAPVAALVFGPPAPVELLLVGGRPVVERGELRSGSEAEIAAAARSAAARLLEHAEGSG